VNDKIQLPNKWVSSLDIINKTGISRATLNNYIKMNIVPRPTVKRPEETALRARMLGYFPESVIDSIIQIKELKKKGCSMDVIADMLRCSNLTSVPGENIMHNEVKTEDTKSEKEAPQSEYTFSQTPQGDTNNPLHLTINDITCPAYLLNNNYEIDWINKTLKTPSFGKNPHNRRAIGQKYLSVTAAQPP